MGKRSEGTHDDILEWFISLDARLFILLDASRFILLDGRLIITLDARRFVLLEAELEMIRFGLELIKDEAEKV